MKADYAKHFYLDVRLTNNDVMGISRAIFRFLHSLNFFILLALFNYLIPGTRSLPNTS
jgi:hypothetical protein